MKEILKTRLELESGTEPKKKKKINSDTEKNIGEPVAKRNLYILAIKYQI